MEISENGFAFIKGFLSFSPEAIQDPAGSWIIGYNARIYGNGKKVAPGDTITEEGATYLFRMEANRRAAAIGPVKVNQNQFDAIASFCFSGLADWHSSSLKKKIIKDPKDPSIAAEFTKANKIGGKVNKELTAQRKAEAELYFS